MKQFSSKYVIFVILISFMVSGLNTNPVSAQDMQSSTRNIPSFSSVNANVYDEPNQLQSYITDLQQATGKTVVREAIEKRTRNSKHYMHPDGTHTAVIGGTDLHYEDAFGKWQDISTELIDEVHLDAVQDRWSKEIAAEATVLIQDMKQKRNHTQKFDNSQTAYRAPHVPFNPVLPKQYSKGYSISKGKDKLTFIPVGASSVLGFVYGKNTVLYTEVWPYADVDLSVIESGIKETIILKDPQAPTSFSFEIKGMLTDKFQSGELIISPAWLVDASGQRRDVTQTISRIGDKTYLSLHVDTEGLSYPIYVDPTVSTVAIDSFYVDEEGSWGHGIFHEYLTVGISNSIHQFDAGIKFDLSTIPPQSLVTSAVLKIHYRTHSYNPYQFKSKANKWIFCTRIRKWRTSDFYSSQPSQLDSRTGRIVGY